MTQPLDRTTSLRKIRSRPVWAAAALAVLLAQAPALSQPRGARLPMPADAADPCPTLRWQAVEGASGYQLAIFALTDGEAFPLSHSEAVLQVTLDDGPAAWRPTPAWCPRSGQRYAWAVRALRPSPSAELGPIAREPMGPWSEPRLLVATTGARHGRHLIEHLETLLEEDAAQDELREILAEAPSGGAPRTIEAVMPSDSAAARADTPTSVSSAASAGGPVAIGSHHVGTTLSQDFELRLDGERGLLVQPTGGSPNLVGGHAANSVSQDVVGATIVGGGGEGVGNGPNSVTDDFGTVGGGRGNTAGHTALNPGPAPFATVGGGFGSSATAERATVVGGSANQASGYSATVGGGRLNHAADSHSTVGGGLFNRALGWAATVPGGYGGKARLAGQLAYAAGNLSLPPQPGDAQWSLYVLLAETADDNPTELAMPHAPDGLTLEVGQTIAFRAHVSATDAVDGEVSAGYLAEGLIENVAGTTSFVGLPTVTVLGEDDAAWDLTLVADDTADSLDFIANGPASRTVRWVAVVRAAEVTF